MRRLVDEHDVAAVCAALEPFAWRRFTPDMLARCLLGALDSRRVQELVAGVPGARAWDAGPLQPADRGDARADVVVEFLAGTRWRSLTLSALCRQVLQVLADEHLQRAWLRLQLHDLTDGAG